MPVKATLGWLAVGVLSLAGCGGKAAPAAPAGNDASSRDQLNLGYSLLYQEAKGLKLFKYIVVMKNETAEVESAARAMTDYCGKLSDEMEAMTRQYPALRIDLPPMSAVQGEARLAMGKQRAAAFAPLIGKTGMDFERELLLMLRDAADEESHIAGALVERETDAGLKHYAIATQARFEALHQRFASLLERRYFARQAAKD